MDPIYAKVVVFINLLVFILIRWPHGNRYKNLAIDDSRKDRLEIGLLIGAFLGTTIIPMIWVTTGFPGISNYPLHPIAFSIGLLFLIAGNWAFFRAHADLGVYWSPTLEMREGHQLVTTGIYERIRHPMYSAMMLQGIGQLLVLPNWIAGPAWLVTFGSLYLLRVNDEEKMLLDRFGDAYTKRMEKTGRLFPARKKN